MTLFVAENPTLLPFGIFVFANESALFSSPASGICRFVATCKSYTRDFCNENQFGPKLASAAKN
jgi:hypothetical protein